MSDTEHDWFKPDFLAYECCRKCGIVKRADGGNGPCKGVVRVEMRDDPTKPEVPRVLSELIGAVGFYLGRLGSAHEGDKDRLGRALDRAITDARNIYS